MVARSDQRQVLRSRIGHVRSDVWKILEKPKCAERDRSDLPLPKEITSAQQGHNQFRKRSAQDHRRIPKYAKDWVPAFMNHQIRVVEKKKTRAARCGVHEKQEIKAQPANSRISRNWLPLTEMFFQEIHSLSVASRKVRRSTIRGNVPKQFNRRKSATSVSPPAPRKPRPSAAPTHSAPPTPEYSPANSRSAICP